MQPENNGSREKRDLSVLVTPARKFKIGWHVGLALIQQDHSLAETLNLVIRDAVSILFDRLQDHESLKHVHVRSRYGTDSSIQSLYNLSQITTLDIGDTEPTEVILLLSSVLFPAPNVLLGISIQDVPLTKRRRKMQISILSSSKLGTQAGEFFPTRRNLGGKGFCCQQQMRDVVVFQFR